MTLVGRSVEIETTASAVKPMTLIVGDSGTGKSVLLEFAQVHTPDAIAPPPVRVNRSPGSLQVGVLEALGAALAEITSDESSAKRVGRLIVAAAEKVKEKRLADLKATVGRHLLGIVRSHVGDELGDVIEDAADALSKSKSEMLSARITSASDSDVVDQIVDFADAVAGLDVDRHIYLALDDIDRLDNSDLRRLLDLAERLPERVRLRCTFATWDAQGRSEAEMLIGSPSVTAVHLGGLSPGHVSEWLRRAGLSEDLTDAVMASTNGYAVHVQDAIALLQVGGVDALDSLAPDDVLRARLARAWRGLDTIHQVAVAKLCAYVDPIHNDRVCSLLGIDGLTWGTIEINLRDSGIFVGSTQSWFHELRRRVIWNELLSDGMRRQAISAALAELDRHLQLPSADLDAFVDYSRLAGLDDDLQSLPCVGAAVSASRDEVAIAAAVLELVESKGGETGIVAEIVLEHVRTTCGFVSDPISALDSLAAQSILYVESDDRMSVIVPMWGSTEALRVIIGRAATELGRIPIQSRASAVFDALIRPELGDFKLGSFGVGRPRIADLSAKAAELHRQAKDGVVTFPRETPSIALLGSHGDVPLYGAFTFRGTEERDRAVTRLQDVEVILWEEPFVVHEAVSLPGPAVPALRFAHALNWLDGGKFDLHMKRPRNLDEPVDADSELRQRLAVREWARAGTTRWERYAFGVEEPSGFGYDLDSASLTVVEVVGRSSVRDVGAIGIEWSGPNARLRAAQALGLGADERIGTITWRSGSYSEDPIGSEIRSLVEHANKFNREQESLHVPLIEGSVQELLEEAHQRRRQDAMALLDALPSAGLSLPPPKRLCVAIRLAEPQPGWVYGHHAALAWMTFPSLSEQDTVELRVLPSVGSNGYATAPSEAEIRELFAEHGERLESGWSDPLHWIARELGHDESSLRLTEPTSFVDGIRSETDV